MSRSTPYLNKPPAYFAGALESMRNTPLYLMSRIGPSVFALKGEGRSAKTHKVYVGHAQRCTCGGGDARGELCIHLLYVMVKVLRVAEEDPLVWQLGLVEGEVDSILAGRRGEGGGGQEGV